MATPVDFPKYLQSLVNSYEKQPDLYTLTDLQVKVEVEIPPEERSQPRSPQNKPETKIERLEVLKLRYQQWQSSPKPPHRRPAILP